MKVFRKTVLFICVLLAPVTLDAQRVGLSISAVGSPSPRVPSSAATAPAALPQMPALPQPLPAAPHVSLSSLDLTLKPLNLSSIHLAPPMSISPLRLRSRVLPALPFALARGGGDGLPTSAGVPLFSWWSGFLPPFFPKAL